MHTLLNDLRHGVRLLARAPGFTVIAVAALAIGIGANTAIFSVVNTLLIQPPPYETPDRLAVIWEHNLPRDRKNNVISPGNFIHWREMQQSFVDLAAVGGRPDNPLKVTLTGNGDPEEIRMQSVSASFFPLLGVNAAQGRVFSAEEDRPQSRVVVMSHRLWTRRYGGDPNILQKSITLQGIPFTVVGIMPPGFSYMDKTVEIWLPIGFSAESRTPRGRWLTSLGRLKPGVTFEQAQTDMARVHEELTRLFPQFNTGWTARVVPLTDELTGGIKPALLVLLGAVGFVLLIACANVANLLLARATSRQRELAVRAALGAARGRIARQLIAEGLVLAVAGGVAGLLLAWWAIHLARVAVAERLPIQRLDAVQLDGWVLLFTLVASLVSGVLFGIVPALSASGAALTDALKEGGRTGSGRRGKHTRNVLAVVEIALALVLLVGAGLLVRSFIRLLNVDPGFNSERVVTMNISLPRSRYPEPAQLIQFYQRLLDRADALPGVEASSANSFLPLTGLGAATGFEVVGWPKPEPGAGPVCDVRVIANDYFKVMGIPLIKGRLFEQDEALDSKDKVIVNATLAAKYWPNEDPIGKRIKISWNDDREDEIIGVVGDVRHLALETEPRPMTYWPYPRFPYNGMALAIRTKNDPLSIAQSVVSIVREQDPNLAVAGIKTLEELVDDSVAQRKLTMVLLGVFAGAAMLLAGVGIYGLIGYTVSQRTQEIGIRMALGAKAGDVLRMVLRQAAMLAGAGIVLGAVGAALLTRFMAGMLYQVEPLDVTTFAAVAAVLAGVALLAAFVPGRRAARVDPVIALRAE